MLAEKGENFLAVSNVDIEVLEALRLFPQPLQVPERISLGAEEFESSSRRKSRIYTPVGIDADIETTW